MDKAKALIGLSCFGGWELSYWHPKQGTIYVGRFKTKQEALDRAKILHKFPLWNLAEPLEVFLTY